MPPLLLESRFNTEAGGGICCDVVRVSPLFQQKQNRIDHKGLIRLRAKQLISGLESLGPEQPLGPEHLCHLRHLIKLGDMTRP